MSLSNISQSGHGVAKQVMSYFLKHPNAADSLEGVARWRLLQERIDRTVAETHVAIQWLVDRDFLEEIRSRSSETVFVLNRAHLSQAQEFVDKAEEEEA